MQDLPIKTTTGRNLFWKPGTTDLVLNSTPIDCSNKPPLPVIRAANGEYYTSEGRVQVTTLSNRHFNRSSTYNNYVNNVDAPSLYNINTTTRLWSLPYLAEMHRQWTIDGRRHIVTQQKLNEILAGNHESILEKLLLTDKEIVTSIFNNAEHVIVAAEKTAFDLIHFPSVGGTVIVFIIVAVAIYVFCKYNIYSKLYNKCCKKRKSNRISKKVKKFRDKESIYNLYNNKKFCLSV